MGWLPVLPEHLRQVLIISILYHISSEQLLEDLFRAYFEARKNKRNTSSQLSFEINLEHNIVTLRDSIMERTYSQSQSRCFIVWDPVQREIFSSAFCDRVVHHLIFNYIAPFFERKMIYDSYSCRKGKGNLLGIARLEHFIRSCSENYTKPAYVLKLDIKGYFMSIRQDLLYNLIVSQMEADDSLCEQIDMDLVKYLLEKVIFRNPVENCRRVCPKSFWNGLPASKSLFFSPKGIGLPIGDYTSQLFSNIYMNGFDQFVKRKLKCKYYGRYVDDFFIVHQDKNFLKSLIPMLSNYLKEELGLTLHPYKIHLQHFSKGISFLGAYIMPYRRMPRRRVISKFKSSSFAISKQCAQSDISTEKKHLATLNSYLGYMQHMKSYNLVKKTLSDTGLIYRYKYAVGFSKAVIIRKYSSFRTKERFGKAE